MIRSAVFLAALALATAAAQAQLRTIPAAAVRGTLTHVQDMNVTLNGRPARLSPGAQIRDENNRIVLPAQLAPESRVKFLPDAKGDLHRVWILTPQEIAQPDPRK